MNLQNVLENLEAFNNTNVFSQDKVVSFGKLSFNVRTYYVDTLKPTAIAKTLEAAMLEYDVEVTPTKEQELAAWGAEGETHNTVFGNRATFGHVFSFEVEL